MEQFFCDDVGGKRNSCGVDYNAIQILLKNKITQY